MLAGAGLFTYLALRADLTDAVDDDLAARAAAIAAAPQPARALADLAPGAFDEADEGFGQLLAPGGAVLARAGGARAPVARRSGERRVAGLEGRARVLARPAPGGRVVVLGRSLEDRDETLAGVVASFAIGGPVAVALASALGWALAAAALAPVERMRRRAARLSLGDDERLPLPRAADEVRRLGETLNAMLDRLRETYDRERRFVADASHELRTPVAVVKTELEAALRAPGLDAGAREALDAALEECDRLAQLAEDLLVLARAADGQLPIRPEALDARALLDRVRERFAARAARQERAIAVDAEGVVWGDELRLAQALGNLVDNALRHGEGEVLLRARPGTLEVRDAGPGFDPAFAPRAFERFARADAARSDAGAGLGLAIVRAIAEAHGGEAALDVAGVRLTLPAREP